MQKLKIKKTKAEDVIERHLKLHEVDTWNSDKYYNASFF